MRRDGATANLQVIPAFFAISASARRRLRARGWIRIATIDRLAREIA